jgi:hypothetical protein
MYGWFRPLLEARPEWGLSEAKFSEVQNSLVPHPPMACVGPSSPSLAKPPIEDPLRTLESRLLESSTDVFMTWIHSQHFSWHMGLFSLDIGKCKVQLHPTRRRTARYCSMSIASSIQFHTFHSPASKTDERQQNELRNSLQSSAIN